MRGMCAAMLSLQAIILLLAAPTLIEIGDVDAGRAWSLAGGLAVLCLLTAGSLRSPAGYVVGHAIQVGTVALGLLLPAMFGVGALFAALWFTAYFLGRRIEADKARWAAEEAGSDDG